VANVQYKIVWQDSGYDDDAGQTPDWIDMGEYFWVLGGAKRAEVEEDLRLTLPQHRFVKAFEGCSVNGM